ncbi:beta-glucosidase [Fusarium bulbicola]|nr:beta-glucosidase [Fusarium bulbicola]
MADTTGPSRKMTAPRVLADQSIKFPSGHLKVLQAGGISAMAKHYATFATPEKLRPVAGNSTAHKTLHPEGNEECFHALLVFEVESVCDDAAVHVEENKPMRLAIRILPLLQIYSKPLHRTKSALVRPSYLLAP